MDRILLKPGQAAGWPAVFWKSW